jgi:hypothetical protein
MLPFWLKAVLEIGPRAGLYTRYKGCVRNESDISYVELTLQSGVCVLVPEVDGAVQALNIDKYMLVSAEKGYIPQVKNVPWTGWKEILLTAYTSA